MSGIIGSEKSGVIGKLVGVDTVGIRTTNPSFCDLEVSEEGGSQPTIGLVSNHTGNAGSRNWQLKTNQAAWGDLCFMVSSANNNTPNGTSVLKIDSSGKLTVVTSASGGYVFCGKNSAHSNKLIQFGPQNTDYCHWDTDTNHGNYFYDAMWVASGTAVTSDEKLKKDVKTVDSALDKINSIRGVTYKWKKDEYPELKYNDKTQFGVIAQEVEKLHPDFVATGSHPTELDIEIKYVDYTNFTPFLIEAVKELSAKNDALEAENTAMKTRMDALEARLTKMEAE